MYTPYLEIYPTRIKDNANSVLEMCHKHGAQVACVTKVTCAHPAVAEAFLEANTDMLADSRLDNLLELKKMGVQKPLLLLRLPAPSEAMRVVEITNISLNSNLLTLKALSHAAKLINKMHKVILMVDVGDLREGVWPENALKLLAEAKKLPNLEIIGMGCNLACYGGVIPTQTNMQIIIETRDFCRNQTGLSLDLISGGNSSGLPLLASGKMPKQINHFRIGEAIVLGRNVLDRSPWQGTRQDTFRLVAEIIELEKKPSVPIGDRGQDAFGGYQEFKDKGIRLRAICNIGRQDVAIDGLEPEDPSIKILGGSSDHLILDVEDVTNKLQVGDKVAFYPGYSALLALATSSYVHKYVIKG